MVGLDTFLWQCDHGQGDACAWRHEKETCSEPALVDSIRNDGCCVEAEKFMPIDAILSLNAKNEN